MACDGNQGGAYHRVDQARLSRLPSAPTGHRAAARLLLWQIELLWRRLIIDYILLRAVRP